MFFQQVYAIYYNFNFETVNLLKQGITIPI